MLIVMENRATEAQISEVCDKVISLGLEAQQMPGAQRTAICVLGNDGSVSERHFADLSGIRDIIRVSKPYKLTSNEVKSTPTIVNIGECEFGGEQAPIIAGPLCVDKGDSTFETAKQLKEQGVTCFRAAAFKDRTNPYNFHGLGERALPILQRIKDELGMSIVTEVADSQAADKCQSVADAFIVEGHNMQNFSLLRHLGKSKTPVILTRANSANIEDVLMAAEYILSGGNDQVILCEAGIKTFTDYATHTLDLNFVQAVKHYTHLPVIVDPSTAAGNAKFVIGLAKAALAVGANGVMIQAHTSPASSVSGGAQMVKVDQLSFIR